MSEPWRPDGLVNPYKKDPQFTNPDYILNVTHDVTEQAYDAMLEALRKSGIAILGNPGSVNWDYFMKKYIKADENRRVELLKLAKNILRPGTLVFIPDDKETK